LKCQITFDCPVCSYEIKGLDQGDGKGNLEINYCRHIYKCWSCSETHGTQGPLGKLFDRFGTKQAKKTYNLVRPDEEKFVAKKLQVRLPQGYKEFKDSNPRFIPHNEALRYLHKRGITDEIIEKYKNPTVPKETIIFNENNIDFSKDIYLVEGAFDMLFLDNSIPLLGKHVSPMLFERLYNEAQGNIHICLDGDAWDDAQKLFHELNGGVLYGRIKIIKPPKDQDVCDLKGDIENYYVELMK